MISLMEQKDITSLCRCVSAFSTSTTVNSPVKRRTTEISSRLSSSPSVTSKSFSQHQRNVKIELNMFSPLVNPANAATVTATATSSSQYMEMISQIIAAFKAGSFSQSSSALTNLALSTPPIAYFLTLL